MMSLAAAVIAATPLCPLVSPGEMAELQDWVSAKLLGISGRASQAQGITVLANNDPVQRNSRAGRPMRIAGTAFTRGLYCHAQSRLVVRLPSPGKAFTAMCGVDSNEQTIGGRGSVVFSVVANEDVLFSSDTMREGQPARRVHARLDGRTEFELRVSDAGDGISCDQADWADAEVLLENGSKLWLADMPIAAQRRPYDAEMPFSLRIAEKDARRSMPGWTVNRSDQFDQSGHRRITVTWRDPATALAVRMEAVVYSDFPTVEWTLYLRNDGHGDTPLISDIRPIHTSFERSGLPCVLRRHSGSPCTPTDYEPYDDPLKPGEPVRVSTSGGRSTNTALPNFNLKWPDQGVIAVLGWPGQWAASFEADAVNSVSIRGGQELTRFVLHSGEEVRTPRVVLQFWQGDAVHAQNVWRRWMLAYNTPHPGGKPPSAQMAACSSHQFGEMINADSASQKLFVDRYLEEGIKLDYWWMDAGWYVNKGGWGNTGTWVVDEQRFPGGLRPITDYARAKGVRSIVWFEPERVNPGTWLYEQRPQWLLGEPGRDRLLNLGDPEARQWWTDHADQTIREQGIDLYRTDFNIDPLRFWRDADAPDRQGITEIRYVTGFLTYLGELRRRHPNLLIDTCASGGRRNDIDTLRHAVPLLRSDYILEPVGQQLHTYGIASWIPFYGTGVSSSDPYDFRSQACPHITGCWDVRKRDLDYAGIRRMYGEWRAYADLMLADYYPLTPYNIGPDAWIAWQFHSPELGRGIVQAFRRDQSVYEAIRVRLGGLDADATYRLKVRGVGRSTRLSGKALVADGLRIDIPARPGAALVEYERVRK